MAAWYTVTQPVADMSAMEWESGAGAALSGQTALVTGGSGGLGRAICEALATAGARVVFTYHRGEDGARKTADALGARGGAFEMVQVDLRDRGATAGVIAAAEKSFGGVDILVNNAAVSEAIPFVLIEDEDLDDLLELNFLAAFRLCRLAARHMIRQKSGRIINISSIAGSRSIPGPVHYAASKGALDAMTRSLAHELGPYGITVNAIAAGIFEGGLRSTIPEHHQKRYLDACALGRFGRGDELGHLVTQLASPRTTYLNGAVLHVDGGTVA